MATKYIVDNVPAQTISGSLTIDGLTLTTNGLLISRMSLSERDAIESPDGGLQVIVTGETGGEFISLYNSSTTSWVTVGSGGGSSPITIENTNSLFSTGLSGTGVNATGATNSNFFGVNAGYQATYANGSNFIGYQAGYQVAPEETFFISNFIGYEAGFQATNASASNFLGIGAGYQATNAQFCNFLGIGAGAEATNASGSNFIGVSAGQGATGAATFGESQTITADNGATSEYVDETTVKWLDGDWASVTLVSANDGAIIADSDGTCTGYIDVSISYISSLVPFTVGETLVSDNGATGEYVSDTEIVPLTGDWAGSTTVTGQTSEIIADISTDAYITVTFTNIRYAEFNSNFIGNNAGFGATAAIKSNFFGREAGSEATNANYSNFIGYQAGYQVTGVEGEDFNSNFIGREAGLQATNASGSNFFGVNAGSLATGASNSNFLGQSAGLGATNAGGSNFFGSSAGQAATGAYQSNFFGGQAGYEATNAFRSNFFGVNAGYQATNAFQSNFIGQTAGYQATGAVQSNFFGINAGYQATGASFSNFFGQSAGNGATDAGGSNFIGPTAGSQAKGASNSNFFGPTAGNQATGAYQSNFFGQSAGNGATDAFRSNFIGFQAGFQATGASFSTLIGFKAGSLSINNNIGSNNIIIGTNISLPSGATNSINFGGVLFGVNTYGNIFGSPSNNATATGRIGVGIVSPTARLHIAASTTAAALMRLEVGPAPTSPNNGDIYYDGTNLKLYNGTWRTIVTA